MKRSFFRVVVLALAGTAGLATTGVAQSEEATKKTTIEVRVIEQKDGKTRMVERNYTIDPLSEGDQKIFIDKVLDSLNVPGMSRKRISITVDDNAQGAGNRQRVEVRTRADDSRDQEPLIWSWRDNDGNRTFRFDTDELRGSVRRMERELRPRLETMERDLRPHLEGMRRDLEEAGDQLNSAWSNGVLQAGTIRALNAYANNPDNGTLNLRFTAPEKGDVSIIVTDTQGKEVGKKTINDFSGEFVGQVELKKNTKGTLFVRVVQNEDGAVRKVTIK